MAILSTDKKLISFGTDYSAGSGISIIDHTISVIPSAVGKTYSAGPNIGIYDEEGQPTISSKDWTQEIDQASSGAVTESTSIFNDWINGQYTGDITTITNNLTALSGDLSSYYKKTETSSKTEISAALDYVSAHAVGDVEVNNYVRNNSATIDEVNSVYQSNSASYITAVNIPESATWNDTSNVVSSNSAQWNQGRTYEGISPIVVNNNENKVSAETWTLSAGNGIALVEDSANNVTRIDCTASGDAGVNSFVTNNSASILEVDTSYRTNSGTFLTAIPSDVATTGDVANLEQTISETYYPKSNPSSFATEDWVTAQGYLTEHQDISNKLDSSAFSSVSGDFLTTAFSIPESATWNDVSTTVQTNSAQWAEGGVGSVSSKYGTITVDGSNIEATNSAIEYKSNGFTSFFNSTYVYDSSPVVLQWDNYSEGTTLHLTGYNTFYSDDATTLTYSSNTNVTGIISGAPYIPFNETIQIPNATAIKFTCSLGRYDLNQVLVTAASSFQVKELAWKSDLPTYTYNSANKLSAINGSALVGNEDYLVQQGFVQNLTSPYGTIAVNNNKVEETNSAIKSDTYIEGFASAYNGLSVYPGNSATLTWANYVPNAKLYVSGQAYPLEHTLTYSADTNVTGTITIPTGGQVSVEVPTDATSMVIGNEDYSIISYNFTVSAEDYYEVGELAWASALPTYESTDNGLVSAIGSSGLYATSAGTASQTLSVIDNGNLGRNIDYSVNGHRMVLNPIRTPFSITSGIYNYLTYATGACIAYGASAGTTQTFGGYFKGNEWFISNGQYGFAIIGGFNRVNANVYLSGARTNGDDFNLSQQCVSGTNSSGGWKYGYEEDTLLRTLSSQIAYLSGVIDQYHS